MSVESFNPSVDSVKVTEAAQRHFKRQLSTGSAKGVRLSVKESGCTGYAYVLDLVDAPEQEDLVLHLDGLEIFLDKASLPVLQGTEIDYVTEGVNSTIRFQNPNAKDYCGCGESFSIN